MNNVLQNIIKVILFLVPAIVILVPDDMFFPFITGKSFAFRILVESAFGLYLALAIINPVFRPKKTLLLLCVSAFTVIIFVADIFAVNPFKAFWSNFERMEGFVTVAHLFLYFVVLSSIFREKKDWKQFLFVSVGVSIFVSMYAVLQLSGVLDIHQGSTRIDATLGNSAYMAVYLLFHIFFLAILYITSLGKIKGIAESVLGGLILISGHYLIYSGDLDVYKISPSFTLLILIPVIALFLIFVRYISKNEKLKIITSHFVFSFLIILDVVLLYFTATRGAVLGFIGGLVVGSIALIIFAKNDRNIQNIGYLIAGFIFVIVLSFIGLRNNEFVRQDPVLSRFASISWSEAQGQARNIIWPMALKGVQDRPLLGWGQEGFTYIFQKYYEPELWKHEPWFDRAHNTFLDWLVAGGILGFLAYLSLYIGALYLLIKKVELGIVEKSLLLGLISAYAFQGLFIFDNIASYILFFALLALIESRSVKKGEEKNSATNETSDMTTVLLLSGVTIGLVFLINYGSYSQNINLIKALKIGGVKDGELVSCEKVVFEIQPVDGTRVNKCVKWTPTLDLFNLALKANLTGTGEAREQLLKVSSELNSDVSIPEEIKIEFAKRVLEEYEKWIKETPDEARIYITYSLYLKNIGQNDLAIEQLLKALEISPTRQQIMFELGLNYLIKEDTSKALEYLKKAYEEDPSYPQAQILYSIAALYDKKNEEAYRVIEKMVEGGSIDSKIVDVLFTLNQANKAISFVEKAIDIDPSNINSYVLLASIYTSLNNKSKAISIFEKMIESNPSLKDEGEQYIQSIKSGIEI